MASASIAHSHPNLGFSIRLTDEFLEPYKKMSPDFGPLGYITYKRTYSRNVEGEERTEMWWETVRRVVEGNINLDPRLTRPISIDLAERLIQEAQDLYDAIFWLSILPPGRGLWMSGTEFSLSTADGNVNCWGMACRPRPYEPEGISRVSYPFAFLFDQSMKGGGVGFSVEQKNMQLIPPVSSRINLVIVCRDDHANLEELQNLHLYPRAKYNLVNDADDIDINRRTKYVLLEDSREGWTEGLKAVIDSHWDMPDNSTLFIDVSDIRERGAAIKRFGGTASGPAPLVELLVHVNYLLNRNRGNFLTSVDCADIANMIGKAVVAGNVRRTAIILVSDAMDIPFARMKNRNVNHDQWGTWALDNHRWTSNNSLIVDDPSFYDSEEMEEISSLIAANGEPGILNRYLAQNYGRIIDEEKPGIDARAEIPNPCVTADTWVMTTEGPRQVKDLVDVPHYVLVNGRPYASRKGFFSTGFKKINHVITKEGFRLRATDNHPILCVSKDPSEPKKWVNVEDLRPGDKIVLADHRKATPWDGEGSFDSGYEKAVAGHAFVDVPETASHDFYLGYFSGLVEKYGDIAPPDKGPVLRFHLPHIQLLQRMLLRIGVMSSFYRSVSDDQEAPSLVIEGESFHRLNALISFTNEDWYFDRSCSSNSFVATVESIEHAGYEDVYDATVDDAHEFDANGIRVHNCSEIFLESGEPCNLFELFPFNAEDNEHDHLDMIRLGVRFMKRVTFGEYGWEQSQEVVDRNRRIGLGISGFQDWVMRRFGSVVTDWDGDSPVFNEELVSVIDDWYGHAIESDREYSKELGVNPSIKVTTVKPSGTVAICARSVSPGAHFHYFRHGIRRVRIASDSPLVPILEEAGLPMEEAIGSPNTLVVEFPFKAPTADEPSFRSAEEVSLKEQLATQVFLQRYWSDNMVSFTASFHPEEAEDIVKLLRQYRHDIKSTSFLPYSGHGYAQAPYEPTNEEEYERRMAELSIRPEQLAHIADFGEYDDSLECADGFCPIR